MPRHAFLMLSLLGFTGPVLAQTELSGQYPSIQNYPDERMQQSSEKILTLLNTYNQAMADGGLVSSAAQAKETVEALQTRVRQDQPLKQTDFSAFTNAILAPEFRAYVDKNAPEAQQRIQSILDYWGKESQQCENLDINGLMRELYLSESSSQDQVTVPLKIILPIWQASATKHFQMALAENSALQFQYALAILGLMDWQIHNKPDGFVYAVDLAPSDWGTDPGLFQLPPSPLTARLSDSEKQAIKTLEGEVVKTQLPSDFSKELFDRYWEGRGNEYVLDDFQFAEIVAACVGLEPTFTDSITLANGQPGVRKIFSLGGSTKFGTALGSATLYYDAAGNPVGMKDFYNFDSHITVMPYELNVSFANGSEWHIPVALLPYSDRGLVKESATNLVSVRARLNNAKPFSIKYGLGIQGE